jgi:glyoxylase-like metal-dependent hydrolase (beta-lactamase superfamily II)
LDVNVGLILGARSCLVIDTGFGGDVVASGVRERTAAPVSVVYTHAHFDHVLGTAAFPGCPVYAHPVCAERLPVPVDLDGWADFTARQGFPAESELVRAAVVVAPTRLVASEERLDLGGREVRILHPGRGHTGGDLIVHIPDVATVFAGDLVEEGAPPQAGTDAFPAEWPATLDTLLTLRPDVVVPGHGAPVDAAFVAAQQASLNLGPN